MAGTGDHQVMKAIAEKRKEFKDFRQPLRLGLYSHAVMINQALGILFMGGGQYSLRHDRQAIAMLLLATYPFGNAAHPAEERHYLAANRHLYAIAVEKRSLQVLYRFLFSSFCLSSFEQWGVHEQPHLLHMLKGLGATSFSGVTAFQKCAMLRDFLRRLLKRRQENWYDFQYVCIRRTS
eukprot:GHVT01043986.1.p3 GENE.GHVT01043986.1~~GHVT01043986.1.p3  ORF type:complete len:179 (+),score=6.27 GHVT01043986.1:797-1333(+)